MTRCEEAQAWVDDSRNKMIYEMLDLLQAAKIYADELRVTCVYMGGHGSKTYVKFTEDNFPYEIGKAKARTRDTDDMYDELVIRMGSDVELTCPVPKEGR